MLILQRTCQLQRLQHCFNSTARTIITSPHKLGPTASPSVTNTFKWERLRAFSTSLANSDDSLTDIDIPEVGVVRTSKSGIIVEPFTSDPGTRKVSVHTLANNEFHSTLDVDDRVIATNPRIDILHRNVVWYRACIRAGTANSQRRGEVRGKAKKPWRQKGTGRARHGSRSSPLWKGGGSAKGPKPKDYSYNLPIPIRRLGLQVALTCRYFQNDLSVVDSFDELPDSLGAFEDLLDERGWQNALFVDTAENEHLYTLTKELTASHYNPLGVSPFKVSSSHVRVLHVYGILLQKKLVVSAKALQDLEQRLLTKDAHPDEYQPKDSMDLKISYERRKFLEKRGVWPQKDGAMVSKELQKKKRRMKVAPELEYYTDGKLPSTSLRQHREGVNVHSELMRWVYNQPGPTLPR